MKTTPPHPGPVNQLPASGIGRRRQPPNLRLVYYPNPILRAVCQPVDHFDTTLRDLVQEMFSLMQIHVGIGLAGPQVAIEKRVLVCAIEGRELCLTNPKLHQVSQLGELIEGCLSLPNLRVNVTRPERIQVSGYDARGRKTRFGATGLWARVIQHEMDHLNGVLICDRGRPPTASCDPCPLAVPSTLVEERKGHSRGTCSTK